MHQSISETYLSYQGGVQENTSVLHVNILKYKCQEIVFPTLLFHFCNSTQKMPGMCRAPKLNNVTPDFSLTLLKIQNNDHYRFLPHADI